MKIKKLIVAEFKLSIGLDEKYDVCYVVNVFDRTISGAELGSVPTRVYIAFIIVVISLRTIKRCISTYSVT